MQYNMNCFYFEAIMKDCNYEKCEKSVHVCRFCRGLENVVFYCALIHVDFACVPGGYFVGIGAILRLTQCQWDNPEEYGSINHKTQRGIINKSKQHRSWCILYGTYSNSPSQQGPRGSSEWKAYLSIIVMDSFTITRGNISAFLLP